MVADGMRASSSPVAANFPLRRPAKRFALSLKTILSCRRFAARYAFDKRLFITAKNTSAHHKTSSANYRALIRCSADVRARHNCRSTHLKDDAPLSGTSNSRVCLSAIRRFRANIDFDKPGDRRSGPSVLAEARACANPGGKTRFVAFQILLPDTKLDMNRVDLVG